MELINIKGNTFYIKGGTNTGVYLCNNKEAIMIDPGLSGSRPKRIIDMLEQKNINLKCIINTHEHNDHYGACSEFKKWNKDINILASSYSKLYIENPELFSIYIIGGKTNEFMEGKLKNKLYDDFKIDNVIEEGLYYFENVEFNTIELQGHTPGSIGVLTKDKVLFIGDVLVGEEILKKFDFLFLFDVGKQLKSLDKVEKIDFNYLVLGHGKNVISKEESKKLIHNHRECIKKYTEQIREKLNHPMTLEKLLKSIIINNNLRYNYKEYHFFKSSLVSVISYLVELGEVKYLLEEGELLYYTKKK